MIPKIIHQTYKDHHLPNNYWKEYHLKWRLLHQTPEWVHKFWTDKDNDSLIKYSFPWLWKTYQSFPYKINKVDCARIAYMYLYGGVYADMDLEPQKSIHPLLKIIERQKDCFGIGQCLRQDFEISFIISSPGHPFWYFVLKQYRAALHGWKEYLRYLSADAHVLFLTGPNFIRNCFLEYSKKFNCRIFFINLHWRKPFLEDDYVIHHNSVSWIKGPAVKFCLHTQRFLHDFLYVEQITALIASVSLCIILSLLFMAFLYYQIYKRFFCPTY